MNFFTKIKHDVFKYASIQLVSKGLSLIATYIIALLTTNEVFGYIAMLQASFLVAITIFGFNLQSGFVRYYFTFPLDQIIKYTSPILKFFLCLSVLLSIFLFFILSGEYRAFFWLPIIGFFSGLGFIISILARSNNKFKIYAFSELLRPILIILLAMGLIFFKFDIISLYVHILLISSFIVFIFGYLNLDELVNLNTMPDESILTTKIIFLYTFPLFLSQVMSLLNNVSDKYILNYYLDIDKVGLYGKAYVFGSSLGLLFDSLMLLWIPYTIKNKVLVLEKHFKKLLNIVYVSLIISFLISLLGLFVYYLSLEMFLFKSEFISVFLIIVSAFISRIGYQVLSPILNAYDKTKLVAKISIFSMLLGLFFNLIFIPYIGILSAALSTLLSFFFYSLFILYFTIKLHRSIYV